MGEVRLLQKVLLEPSTLNIFDAFHIAGFISLPVPGNAEQVVERGAELLHAGLIGTEGDVEDQTTAPVFPA